MEQAKKGLESILARPGPNPLHLDNTDLDTLVCHLHETTELNALSLAILARSTHPNPSAATREVIEHSLEARLAHQDSKQLVEALHLLTALFKVSPEFAVNLCTSQDHLRAALQHAVARVSNPIHSSGEAPNEQDEDEKLALVELLSLAAGQPQLRPFVQDSHARTWLQSLLFEQENPLVKVLAGVAIVKLRMAKPTSGVPTTPEQQPQWSMSELADMFVDTVVATPGNDKVLLVALEGLAYLTLSPTRKVKQVASRPELLSILFSQVTTAKTKVSASTTAARDYAVATLLNHLTRFPEQASQDRAQIERLERFASAASSADGGDSQPESTSEITARVSLMVKHDPSPVPLVRQLCLSQSLQTRRLAAQILHSFVTPQPLRGQLLQQGVARLLLTLIRYIPTNPFEPSLDLAPVQALAKLLITANPILVFGPTSNAPLLLEATLALTLPLSTASTPQLATFEALMALTNIASLDPQLADKIARFELKSNGGFDPEGKGRSILRVLVDDLWLNDNHMITRAATQLVCNLVGSGSSTAIEFFEPSTSTSSSSPAVEDEDQLGTTPASTGRLHLVLALAANSIDLDTRQAASGALTCLVYSPGISATIVRTPKYRELACAIVRDEDEGVRHRGIEMWRALGEILLESAVRDETNALRNQVEEILEALQARLELESNEMLKGALTEAVSSFRKLRQ
ncbi:She4p [Sporobolomyces koalae]|uniref:She4p n=1 Tax=Sporobolomyces koalae TaxID=500713 RepID=UPI00317C258D